MKRTLVICFSALLLVPCGGLRAEDTTQTGNRPAPITLDVDATGMSRRLLHSHLSIPVSPGSVTLYYPKWIPGEHAPTGPIDGVVGLKLSVNGQLVPWRRDLVDLYAFHCQIPAGASSLQVDLDYSIPVDPASTSTSASASSVLGMLNWNQVLLYPAGFKTDDLTFQADLRLPSGWKFGTALPVLATQDAIRFQPVSLTTLVDSPVIAGHYYRHIDLVNTAPTAEMDIVGETPEALELPAEKIAQYRRLVYEAGALFGATHYQHYHFLITLSDETFHDGIEHHESSLNAVPENAFTDKDALDAESDLLPHEFVHSWNGKYRRPADLATPDFQKPMLDDLLWVYEGLTEYLGSFVLTARSGLRSAELSREWLASVTAEMDDRGGRRWRPLQDTADDASQLYDSPDQWRNRRREVDFYPEGVLLWLEADTIIRQLTNGTRSLDDFCRIFHGGLSGPPIVKTYTFEDVIETLNSVAPYDWRKFWIDRLTSTSTHAPMKGLEAAGWRLTYSDRRNLPFDAFAKEHKYCNESYSLGLILDDDGVVVDVVANSPADVAQLSPAMKIIAVNARAYSADRLREAIKAAALPGAGPIELIVNNSDRFQTVRIDYHGDLRYPHLEHDGSRPDLLGVIIAPRAEVKP